MVTIHYNFNMNTTAHTYIFLGIPNVNGTWRIEQEFEDEYPINKTHFFGLNFNLISDDIPVTIEDSNWCVNEYILNRHGSIPDHPKEPFINISDDDLDYFIPKILIFKNKQIDVTIYLVICE